MELDDWQKEFINCKEDKILVAGRQTGKSEAAAYDNAEFIANNEGVTALVISKTERQSQEMIIKILNFVYEKYPKKVGKGELKPLKSVVWINHGKGKKPSRALCLPVGLAAEGIRGYTIDKLTVEEAQLPPQDVYDAVLPMLLVTGGKMTLIGTFKGKRGFFWKSFADENNLWKKFRVNSEEVIENRPISPSWPEWRREAGLNFLKKAKALFSDKMYRQEFMAEAVEDLDDLFSEEWIKKVCVLNREGQTKGRFFLGVDVGRTQDPSTFEILEDRGEIIKQVENIVRFDYSITKTADECLELNQKYDFKEMGIDGGGLGAGVVDILMKEMRPESRVKDLNNAFRIIDKRNDKEKGKKLLKEQMYLNLQAMGEKGKIKLLADADLKMSLASCQIEYKEGTDDIIVYGSDTHIVEGLIRAAWLANKKNLSIWCR